MPKIILTPPLTEFLDPLCLHGSFDNASLIKLASRCAAGWVEMGIAHRLNLDEIVCPFGLRAESLDKNSAVNAIARVWVQQYWATKLANPGGHLQ
ncbi:hypothetical protein OAT88_01095 [Gammaproteobacteria bacterium]|nr:hypothetical protein [Gammaproteobacteria bacterium]